MIYTKTECPYCDKAKNLLKQKNINFLEKPIDDYDKKELEIKYNVPIKTVPQILYNGEYIGGYQELESYVTKS